MDKLRSRSESYYVQCVTEANKEANIPFITAEVGDLVKVRKVEDLLGTPLVKGIAYEIVSISEHCFSVKPLSYKEQSEFMYSHQLNLLNDDDFQGFRTILQTDAILFKRTNVERYFDFLRIQKKAYGMVNQDAYWGEKNKFVTSEVYQD